MSNHIPTPFSPVEIILSALRSARQRHVDAIRAIDEQIQKHSVRLENKRVGWRTQPPTRRKRRRMSLAARKKLSERMKARWAERKQSQVESNAA